MDIKSRLPGCEGQAADAVSDFTQVKMEDAHTLLKIPKSECPDIWIRLPRHKWPKSWSNKEGPVVLLERNLYGHPLVGLSWERQFEKILLKHGWEKIPNWECLFVHREKGLFLSVYVDGIKLAGKKHNIDPMWKLLNKEVDLGEPTSFLDHVYLGCTQRKCEISQDIVDNYRTMFEIANFRGGFREITIPSKSSYFFVVMWHGGSCQEMCGAMLWDGEQNDSPTLKSLNSLQWWPSLQRWRIEIRYTWHELDDLIFYGQWTSLHDQSQNGPKLVTNAWIDWFHTCITNVNTDICCHVGNTAKQCSLGQFEDSDFARDLEDSKSTSGRTLCVFGSHTFVPISWMCKKQTSVSHISTESEIISLDSGFRLDGFPVLDLWDLIIAVLRVVKNGETRART